MDGTNTTRNTENTAHTGIIRKLILSWFDSYRVSSARKSMGWKPESDPNDYLRQIKTFNNTEEQLRLIYEQACSSYQCEYFNPYCYKEAFLTQLKAVQCTTIALQSYGEGKCCVCTSDTQDLTSCGHSVCQGSLVICIERDPSCPLCRQPIQHGVPLLQKEYFGTEFRTDHWQPSLGTRAGDKVSHQFASHITISRDKWSRGTIDVRDAESPCPGVVMSHPLYQQSIGGYRGI